MGETREVLSTLADLGLNVYEAKVYLSLLSEGTATAKGISSITSIPYGKVYEVANALHMKGFVAITPSKPMKFVANTPEFVISLHQKKSNEKLDAVREQLSGLSSVLEGRLQAGQSSKLWVINGRSAVNKQLGELFSNAKKRLTFVMGSHCIGRFVVQKDALLDAKSRGVQINAYGNIANADKEDLESLSFCNWKQFNTDSCQLFVIDSGIVVFVDPIPNDDDVTYGRDISALFHNERFANIIEQLLLNKKRA